MGTERDSDEVSNHDSSLGFPCLEPNTPHPASYGVFTTRWGARTG